MLGGNQPGDQPGQQEGQGPGQQPGQQPGKGQGRLVSVLEVDLGLAMSSVQQTEQYLQQMQGRMQQMQGQMQQLARSGQRMANRSQGQQEGQYWSEKGIKPLKFDYEFKLLKYRQAVQSTNQREISAHTSAGISP